jgi:hypothetical protein
MVTTFVPTDSHEAVCPACGVAIRITGRRRRVQCPKCREIVTIEPAADPQTRLPEPPATAAGNERARIDALESRVAAIEEAMKKALAAGAGARPAVGPPAKLRWFPKADANSPEIPPAQQEALIHNLGTVGGQTIIIRFVAGNPDARARAAWFKSVFERANWIVRGPEEIAPACAEAELSLAVASLPVEKEAAATYLALKAAGFEVTTVLDPDLAAGAEDRGAPLSFILAAAKAA